MTIFGWAQEATNVLQLWILIVFCLSSKFSGKIIGESKSILCLSSFDPQPLLSLIKDRIAHLTMPLQTLIATAQVGIEEGGEEEETRGKRQKSNCKIILIAKSK